MTQHNAATAADVSTKRVPRPTATGIRRCTGPGRSPHRTADTNATIRNAIREKEYQTRPRRHHHHRPRHLPRRRRRRRPRRRRRRRRRRHPRPRRRRYASTRFGDRSASVRMPTRTRATIASTRMMIISGGNASGTPRRTRVRSALSVATSANQLSSLNRTASVRRSAQTRYYRQADATTRVPKS